MKILRICGLIAATLMLAGPAWAFYPYTVDESVSLCDPQAPANCVRPLLTPVVGTQVGVSISSATALTVPAGAKLAAVQAQGTNNSSGVCLNWRDDGTAPTGANGQQLAAGATLFYGAQLQSLQLIAATDASCTMTVSYYK